MLNSVTVSQLNTYVKSLIENDARIAYIAVSGEISNFKNHFSSGHWYFTLKDKNASIRCVMFRSHTANVKFNVTDGMAVVVRGRVSLYEKDGQYQFYAEDMAGVGEGDLALNFKLVKEKLEKEGLFDSQNKRTVVKYPKRIAVITSDTGAAVRDILSITEKRFPMCEIVMCPVLVQGENAASDMIKTLDRVYSLNNIDTVIIGRGGGSAEDLHCFNDENLARKIYESPFPVISAVGHETDFTICDFVADVRAATPSHAAEIATPDCSDIKIKILQLEKIIKNRLELKYKLNKVRFDSVYSKTFSGTGDRFFEKHNLALDNLNERMFNSLNEKIQKSSTYAEKLFLRLDALSPLKVMARGFGAVTKNGEAVKSVSQLKTDDTLKVNFADGNIECTVNKVELN